MIDNNEQTLQIDYDEDIILPDTYRGEVLYIIACLKDIFHNKKQAKTLFRNLIRQIKIHHRWMKVK